MGIRDELGPVYRRHARALRRQVMEALRDESDFAVVRRQIRTYLRREDVAGSLRERLIEEAERQFTWIDRRSMPAEDRALAREALSVADQFATVEGAIDENLKREVLRALEANVPRRELEGRLARAMKLGRHRAFTIGNTAVAGVDRASFWRGARELQAEDAEAVYFKYVGPPAERSFCEEHLGRVYTEAEIEALQNGQNLPVRLYGGGYNCRHRWVLAPKEDVEARRQAEQSGVEQAAALPERADASSSSGAAPARSPSVAIARQRFAEIQAQSDYTSVPEQSYFNAETGGFVVTHVGHQQSGFEGEMRTARYFADQGVQVQLLNETGQGPFADALHGGPDGDGLEWDYKQAEAGGDAKSQVQNAIRRGKKPSGNIAIRFEQPPQNIKKINQGVGARMYYDSKRRQPLINRIVILYEVGDEIVEEALTTEEWYDGRRFQGPKEAN